MFQLMLENENSNVVDINDGVNYLVVGVSGLNPPPASIFTAKSPNRKGVKYNGSTLNERNIVISIKLLGDVEENRNALYSWIDTEQYCKVRYRNGQKNVYCEGHVQDCDFDIFTDNEVIGLAILCSDPYWKDLQEIEKEISAAVKLFSFPFAIAASGVPFSTLQASPNTNIFNAGAETGIRIVINCFGDVENLTLYNAKDTTQKFTINTKLLNGWIVVIDSEHSPKTCIVTKTDGTTENLLKYVGANPTWFNLKKGNNYFGYTAESGATHVSVTFSFSNKYLGV